MKTISILFIATIFLFSFTSLRQEINTIDFSTVSEFKVYNILTIPHFSAPDKILKKGKYYIIDLSTIKPILDSCIYVSNKTIPKTSGVRYNFCVIKLKDKTNIRLICHPDSNYFYTLYSRQFYQVSSSQTSKWKSLMHSYDSLIWAGTDTTRLPPNIDR